MLFTIFKIEFLEIHNKFQSQISPNLQQQYQQPGNMQTPNQMMNQMQGVTPSGMPVVMNQQAQQGPGMGFVQNASQMVPGPQQQQQWGGFNPMQQQQQVQQQQQQVQQQQVQQQQQQHQQFYNQQGMAQQSKYKYFSCVFILFSWLVSS